MSAFDWLTTKTALDTAIASANGPDLAILTDMRARLAGLGNIYDTWWAATAGIDAAKTAYVTAYTTARAAALTVWLANREAALVDADHAARTIENGESIRLGGVYVVTDARVGSFVLASTSAIPFAADEAPIASAQIDLLATATPVMRLVAKESGTPGNRVEAKVEDATSGSSKCKITVRLGTGYSEVYDEIAPGSAPSLGGSLLLTSATALVATRPDSSSFAALTGGTGGALAAVQARLDRAMRLPFAADRLAVLAKYQAALTAAYKVLDPGAPGVPSNAYTRYQRGLLGVDGKPRTIQGLEQDLEVLVVEAVRTMAVAG